MQITIVQVEIEEAIIAQIKRQITINDDQEITVDLRATRGAEGYQAVIDIRPKKGGSSSAPESPEPKSPSSAKPLGIVDAVKEAAPAKTTKAAAPAPEKPKAEAEPAPVVAKETAVVEAQTEKVDAPMDTEVAAEVPAAEEAPAPSKSIFASRKTEAEVPAEANKPKTPSIFEGLKKPVNA